MLALADATWIALSGVALGFGLLAVVNRAVTRKSDIRAELGSLKIMVGHVHDAVNDRPAHAPTMSHQVAMIDDKVDGVVAQLDSLSGQIVNRDRLVDARFDSIEGRVGDIDGRLTSLAAHVFTHPGMPEGSA